MFFLVPPLLRFASIYMSELREYLRLCKVFCMIVLFKEDDHAIGQAPRICNAMGGTMLNFTVWVLVKESHV